MNLKPYNAFFIMNEKEFQFSLVTIGNKLIELRKKKGYNSHEDFALDFELPRVQ